MPWTAADATKHTKKATTDKLKRQWARIANSVRAECIDDGGEADDCDAKAIQQANGTIAKEVEEMADLQEALTKKVAGHNLKSSDFLVVEDPEKTTTWHLPVKVNGKADRKLAAAAWAALFSAGGHRGKQYAGPNKAEAKRKLKALYKAEGWEQPTSEAEIQAQANLCEISLEEFFGYDTIAPVSYSSAVTFADLDAQRDVEDSIQEIREDTADLWMMVDNVMWHSEVTDKVGALRSLFDEYLGRIQKHLGAPGSEESAGGVEEAAESSPVDLAEQAAALSVSETTIDDLAQFDAILTEQNVELSDPRRAPVMVDFAIIKPGHGNKKDRRYYPAEMLERDGGAFEGVDIYVTNHDPDEKTERNKVGRFRDISGLREEGLVGTSILYDPDVAEKARNRADAGELGTLHCSILATGTGKKAEIDGQEVTVIEAITQVHSVDLVSKAGAGGHAIALTESAGGSTMDEQDKKDQEQEKQPLAEQEEPQSETVEIRESDAEEEPEPLTEEAVTALLAESKLDDKARRWLEGRTYQDEESVKKAIEEMRAFISEIAPDAGQPFALGESEQPVPAGVPKVLSEAEIAARRLKETRELLMEIDPTYAANL